ncbi:MAG: hypothetical protein WEB58_11405 [Planctomycetaceae bacterium]
MDDRKRTLLDVWNALARWSVNNAPCASTFSSAVDKPAKAFQANIRRLTQLARSLDNASLSGKVAGCIEVCARYHFTGTPGFDIDMSDNEQRENQKKAAEYANKWMRGDEEMPAWVHLSTATSMDFGDFIMSTMHDTNMLSATIEGLMGALITGTWTAIEVLAGDLWEDALNHHPDGLARLTGRKNRIGGKRVDEAELNDDTELPEHDTQDRKSILLSDLERVARGRYDLSHLMGTLLRQRFSFSTLGAIREAYSVAFSEKLKPRPKPIDECLSNKSLDAVSLIRNLLVHRAGVADDTYIKRSRSIPQVPQLKVGEKWQASSDTVEVVIAPAIEKISELIQAVDDWIKAG